MRKSVLNIVVNSLDSSGFLNFDILVEDIRRQVLAPHLTIRGDHDLVDLESSGQGPKFWQFFSDFLNVCWDGCGAMIVILGVDEGCVDFIGKSWWWCPDMISQRSCWDIMFEDNFCQIKVWMHSKIDQTSLFCAFIPLPSKKKHENVKKYNFLQMISCWDICHLSGC